MLERSTRLGACAALVLMVLGATTAAHDASACSCMPPRFTVLGPSAVDDVPLNARVRVEAPSGPAAAGAEAGPEGRLVLRAHEGAEIDVAVTSAPDGMVSLVELVPRQPLAPGALYEVALVGSQAVPPNRVLAAFRTGAAGDRTAPVIAGTARAVAVARPGASSAACQLPGPWLDVTGLTAEDPGRPNAKLAWAIWLAEPGGKIDTAKAPWALRESAADGTVRVGASSLCDPHARPLPKGPILAIAIAAVDEAGNASPPERLSVDLRAARRP